MTIPEIREELLALATEIEGLGLPLWGYRVRYLVREMYRRSPVRRAPACTPFVAPEVIRAHASAAPGEPYMELAAQLGTNIGRVSEALAGKRT